MCYDKLYKTYKLSSEFTAQDVQTFLVSAIKPQSETREPFGYKEMRYPGVYESQAVLLRRVTLISLNELADEPYNAVFKLFATHKIEKQKAFAALERSRPVSLMPRGLKSLFSGLLSLGGEEDMTYKLTPEQVREVGQIWGKTYLQSVPLEERLAGTNPLEVMDYLRLAGTNPLEVIDHLRLAGANPLEVMDHLNLSTVQIEEYLNKRKQEEYRTHQ